VSVYLCGGRGSAYEANGQITHALVMWGIKNGSNHMENLDLLEKPIEQFQLSIEFLEMCRINNFKKLSEILKYNVSELIDKPGFRMRMLKELIYLLEKYQLEDYLKD
jgi:DNA-directed RNA polymerase alpha subunit